VSDETTEPQEEPAKGAGRVARAVKEAPLGVSASVVLAALFGVSQAVSGIQDLLDSRYSKREELTRVEAQNVDILRRLDRMEAKLDALSGGKP
jgi:hypothetical protein